MGVSLRNYQLLQLQSKHKAEMMRLQEQVLAMLPDPRWYFPSEEEEFDCWLRNGDAFGFFMKDTLCGYAVITPASLRGNHSYAVILGENPEDTYDFHDVIVHPSHRRIGMHTAFLSLFREMVMGMGGRAIYATVDPENSTSYRNFEREGYECQCTRPAYDGRPRRYYRLVLPRESGGQE